MERLVHYFGTLAYRSGNKYQRSAGLMIEIDECFSYEKWWCVSQAVDRASLLLERECIFFSHSEKALCTFADVCPTQISRFWAFAVTCETLCQNDSKDGKNKSNNKFRVCQKKGNFIYFSNPTNWATANSFFFVFHFRLKQHVCKQIDNGICFHSYLISCSVFSSRAWSLASLSSTILW